MVTLPNDETKPKFKKLRNEAKKLIMTEKRKFYDNQLGSCYDSEKIFQVFNNFCGKKKSNFCKLEVNEMNIFFATIGPTLSKNFVEFKDNNKISRNSNTFVFFPTDVDEMTKVIKNLMNKNSTGHDGLSNLMIKLCAPVIMKLLVVCFNEMFDSESFPDDCKIAKVTVCSKVEVKLILVITDPSAFYQL